MDKELFRKTEGRLYRYYKSKNDIYKLEIEIESLENRKQVIEHDIKSSNVTIDYYQNGIGITERVQSSSTGTSYAETEMCKEIEKLEREHLRVTKKILKSKAKVRDIEEFINHMDHNIEQLSEEDKRFIELKYGDKKNILQISLIINMAQATCYRKRGELVQAIAEYDFTLLCSNFDKKMIKK
ncbi:transcriptional regulator [Clostridium paraputrificum]|uniref:transcriptional regulator n=1 Tax=Clostridium paraputrificum TaxID=29363 RepID=UPI003D327536